MDLPLAVSLRTYYPPTSRRLSHWRLVLCSLDGKTRRTLTDGPYDDTDVAWIDDHRLIFVRTYARAAQPPQVCRLDTRTGAQTTLYTGRRRPNLIYQMALSPDRRRIALIEQDRPMRLNDLDGDDRVLLIQSGRTSEIARGYEVDWADATHLNVSTPQGAARLDVRTRTRAKAPEDEDRWIVAGDGRRWRVEVGVDDETAVMLVDAQGNGRKIRPDAALQKALAETDHALSHLHYLRPTADNPNQLWIRSFDHRALPTVHARLDPTTGAATYWFTSVGPTRSSSDGKWIYTYPMEAYTAYGKGRTVATRNLLRTPLAQPGKWQSLFSGIVHMNSYSFR